MNFHQFKTNNYWKDRTDPKTGKRYFPEKLVLHMTDGTSKSAKAWFKDPNSYASANYLVDEDGRWWEVVPPEHAAWANGRVVNPTTPLKRGVNPNLYTISVELANVGLIPSWNQWISWARGCREICHKWNIPMNEKHIIDHKQINALKRCPGLWGSRSWLLFLQRYL